MSASGNEEALQRLVPSSGEEERRMETKFDYQQGHNMSTSECSMDVSQQDYMGKGSEVTQSTVPMHDSSTSFATFGESSLSSLGTGHLRLSNHPANRHCELRMEAEIEEEEEEEEEMMSDDDENGDKNEKDSHQEGEEPDKDIRHQEEDACHDYIHEVQATTAELEGQEWDDDVKPSSHGLQEHHDVHATDRKRTNHHASKEVIPINVDIDEETGHNNNNSDAIDCASTRDARTPHEVDLDPKDSGVIHPDTARQIHSPQPRPNNEQHRPSAKEEALRKFEETSIQVQQFGTGTMAAASIRRTRALAVRPNPRRASYNHPPNATTTSSRNEKAHMRDSLMTALDQRVCRKMNHQPYATDSSTRREDDNDDMDVAAAAGAFMSASGTCHTGTNRGVRRSRSASAVSLKMASMGLPLPSRSSRQCSCGVRNDSEDEKEEEDVGVVAHEEVLDNDGNMIMNHNDESESSIIDWDQLPGAYATPGRAPFINSVRFARMSSFGVPTPTSAAASLLDTDHNLCLEVTAVRVDDEDLEQEATGSILYSSQADLVEDDGSVVPKQQLEETIRKLRQKHLCYASVAIGAICLFFCVITVSLLEWQKQQLTAAAGYEP